MTERKHPKPDDVTFEKTQYGICMRWRWRAAQVPLALLVFSGFAVVVGMVYNIRLLVEFGELGISLLIPLMVSVVIFLYCAAETLFNETSIKVTDNQLSVRVRPIVEFWKNHEVRLEKFRLVSVEQHQDRRYPLPSVDVVVCQHDARPKIIISHLQRLDIAEYVAQEINLFLNVENLQSASEQFKAE